MQPITILICGCLVVFDFNQFSINFGTTDYRTIEAIQNSDEYQLKAHDLIVRHDALYYGKSFVFDISSPVVIKLSEKLLQIYIDKVNSHSTVFKDIPSLAKILSEKNIISENVVTDIKILYDKVQNLNTTPNQSPSPDNLREIYEINGRILEMINRI